MSSFKCFICERTFSRCSTLTRHTNKCLLTIESSDEADNNEPLNTSHSIINVNDSLEFDELHNSTEGLNSNVCI